MTKHVLIKNINFRYIWLAHLISQFGDSFFDVAIVVYIMLQTNNSAFLAGGIAVAAILGRLFAGVVSVRIIDFYHTKTIMLCADVVRMLLIVFLLVILTFTSPPLFVYYAVCFLLSFFTELFTPARNKSVAEMIDSDTRAEANNADAFSSSIVIIVSWLLGGIVCSLFGMTIILLIDLITFFLSFFLVIRAQWESKRVERSQGDVLSALQEIRQSRKIKSFFLIQTSYLFFCGFYWSALPLKVMPIGGEVGYGLQGAAFGIGSLIMTILFHRVKIKTTQALYGFGVAINVLGNLLAAVTGNIIIFVCCIFIAGVGNPMWGISEKLYIQEGISLQRQGSVWGVYGLLISIVLIPSWLIGSYLADMLSATVVMVFSCVFQIVLIGIFVWFQRNEKRTRENTV